MHSSEFQEHIIKTLLYYEIFDHPLSMYELFVLLSKNSITETQFARKLAELQSTGTIEESQGFYKLPSNTNDVVQKRIEREHLAQHRMKIARLMAGIIKRFPFVRGIFLSGDLSKGVAFPGSDIDYVIVTVPNRLWICRSLLILFKKIFLLNSKKYFCLNYFVAENKFTLEDQNYYTATEIAHLKPLFNFKMFRDFMNANRWVYSYFPNFTINAFLSEFNDTSASALQKILERFFTGTWADRLDIRLMNTMKRIWIKRYPQYDQTTRDKIFRCTPTESCAYAGNFSDKILSLYRAKLSKYHF